MADRFTVGFLEDQVVILDCENKEQYSPVTRLRNDAHDPTRIGWGHEDAANLNSGNEDTDEYPWEDIP